MKKKNITISFLFFALFACSLGVFAGGEDTFVDDYKISSKQDFAPDRTFQKSWEITYGESNRPVEVLLKETKKGEEYIVRTKYFEVKYVNSKKGFGARSIDTSELLIPASLNDQVINQDQLANQKLIIMSQVDRERALALIADFLPQLVNVKYQNILN